MVNLSMAAADVSLDSVEYRGLTANLQGNILQSHGRDVAYHIFLSFTGPPARVREWLRSEIAPRLYTAADQLEQSRAHREDANFDGGLVLTFFLSAQGYRYLNLDPERLTSRRFRKGMKNRSDGLSEITGTDNKDPKPSQWEEGFQKDIHALVALADDEPNETGILNALSLLKVQLVGLADIVTIEIGRTLRRKARTPAGDPEPIEHFGYFDGVSQPLFTSEQLQKYYAKQIGTNPARGWDPSASLDLVLVPDPFTDAPEAFGSYLVYRKLAQDYGAFRQRTRACAAAVGIDEALAGAYAVGRFEDGTPVVDSPQPLANFTNDFMFEDEDEEGDRCPRHAHIRKVNPRGTTPLTSLEKERRRRIVRRGIPYGKPVPAINSDAAQTDPDPSAARGLLFMCFQANIEKQFEFIQRTWVDNPNFPVSLLNPFKKDTGDDPLIGQDKDEGQRWPKKWDDHSSGRRTFNFEAAVTLKGGEYLFAPSKASLLGM
jgi:deferrochelatase/peroxidase EfeB